MVQALVFHSMHNKDVVVSLSSKCFTVMLIMKRKNINNNDISDDNNKDDRNIFSTNKSDVNKK